MGLWPGGIAGDAGLCGNGCVTAGGAAGRRVCCRCRFNAQRNRARRRCLCPDSLLRRWRAFARRAADCRQIRRGRDAGDRRAQPVRSQGKAGATGRTRHDRGGLGAMGRQRLPAGQAARAGAAGPGRSRLCLPTDCGGACHWQSDAHPVVAQRAEYRLGDLDSARRHPRNPGFGAALDVSGRRFFFPLSTV